MTVLLIRANRNIDDRDALLAEGIDSHIDPYLTIRAVENPGGAERLVTVLEACEPVWLVITSQNAFTYWYQQAPPGSLEALLGKSSHIRYGAIGQTTAQVLEVFGVRDVVVPEGRNSASLADLIASSPPCPIAIPAGNISMRSLPQRLGPAGFDIVEEVFYATAPVLTTPRSVSQVMEGTIDTALLRSPSAARAFFGFVPEVPRAFRIVCGGETTAHEVRRLGFAHPLVAADPSPLAVARLIAGAGPMGAKR